ncbi:MAG: molybdenum cofactor guanylyltransferase [Chloroflexi bacterium]|nr:MAG: molybdenum cofactor guanylyltransferase [Chloroflexota bacterium]
MVTTRLGDQLVGHPRSAGGGLGVPRQQDRHHVDGFVVARQLLERAARDGRPEVSLCGLDVTPHRHVQPLRGGQVDVEIDGSHGRRMIVTMDATLLVLAGGASRRMGRPKAWLEVGNTILLRWVADRLGSKFNEVIVAFAEPEQIEQPIPYRVVFDRRRAAGPLAGIEAGLEGARHDPVFVIACDMPFVTYEVADIAVAAARTCDAAVPRIDGRPEPVCAAYRKSALPLISEALESGSRRAAEVLARMDVTWLEHISGDVVRSLNTPDDYLRFRVALGPSDN